MGLSEAEPATIYDREEGVSDDVAPGALKKPEEAYQRAREDLKSKIWQTEIDGLDVIVR